MQIHVRYNASVREQIIGLRLVIGARVYSTIIYIFYNNVAPPPVLRQVKCMLLTTRVFEYNRKKKLLKTPTVHPKRVYRALQYTFSILKDDFRGGPLVYFSRYYTNQDFFLGRGAN